MNGMSDTEFQPPSFFFHLDTEIDPKLIFFSITSLTLCIDVDLILI